MLVTVYDSVSDRTKKMRVPATSQIEERILRCQGIYWCEDCEQVVYEDDVDWVEEVDELYYACPDCGLVL
jgi:DNA-directed RNA polymerase subunit RPC12/RpoP